VRLPRGDRRRLDRLCRYVARPPLGTEGADAYDTTSPVLLLGLNNPWAVTCVPTAGGGTAVPAEINSNDALGRVAQIEAAIGGGCL